MMWLTLTAASFHAMEAPTHPVRGESGLLASPGASGWYTILAPISGLPDGAVIETFRVTGLTQGDAVGDVFAAVTTTPVTGGGPGILVSMSDDTLVGAWTLERTGITAPPIDYENWGYGARIDFRAPSDWVDLTLYSYQIGYTLPNATCTCEEGE